MNALSGFLDWCDQSHCSLASGGSSRDLLQQLIARVNEAPFSATYTVNGVTREGTLTPSLLESAVLSMLYDRSRGWPILADSLARAVQGGSGAALLQLADQYLRRNPDGTWQPVVEANAVRSNIEPSRNAKRESPKRTACRGWPRSPNRDTAGSQAASVICGPERRMNGSVRLH